MKKIAALTIVIIFGFVCIGFACELIVRVTEGSYAPFFIKENGRYSGLSIELTEALFKEAGCKAIYKPFPFKRSLAYIKHGEIHLMLNLTVTEEREAYTRFIGPQLDETVVLVIHKDSRFNIASLEDMKKLPKSIGVEIGKVYGKEFEDKRKHDIEFRSKIEIVTDVAFNVRKLQRNRLSGFLGYGYNVYYKIKKDPEYKNFVVHPYIVNQNWVHFGFSKKSVSEDMIKKLQEAYNRATRKGVFKKIKQQYR